ncbi:hypothetical protein K501DRAFT_284550 [Backusella circina FSU 941]|nr:hypothetical protein K501DRAFT_284550 [Backusella circina FSU 941]
MALEDKKFTKRHQAKSVILSWFSHSKPSAGKTELDDDFNIPLQPDTKLEIPLRHQSRMYTPYHNPTPSSDANNASSNIIKRQSYNGKDSPNKSFYSQLNRSASWQPQRQQQKEKITLNNESNNDILKEIPDRRTSRNYVNDPEAQAKLESLLNNERFFYIPRASLDKRS